MTCPHPEKDRHRNEAAALKARDSLEAVRGIDLALRPYPCGDHWHLGHRHKNHRPLWMRRPKGKRKR